MDLNPLSDNARCALESSRPYAHPVRGLMDGRPRCKVVREFAPQTVINGALADHRSVAEDRVRPDRGREHRRAYAVVRAATGGRELRHPDLAKPRPRRPARRYGTITAWLLDNLDTAYLNDPRLASLIRGLIPEEQFRELTCGDEAASSSVASRHRGPDDGPRAPAA